MSTKKTNLPNILITLPLRRNHPGSVWPLGRLFCKTLLFETPFLAAWLLSSATKPLLRILVSLLKIHAEDPCATAEWKKALLGFPALIFVVWVFQQKPWDSGLLTWPSLMFHWCFYLMGGFFPSLQKLCFACCWYCGYCWLQFFFSKVLSTSHRSSINWKNMYYPYNGYIKPHFMVWFSHPFP